MNNQAYVYCSESTSPYHNLAVEEMLLEMAKEKDRILYLWQNKHTVVIGRNQNAFKECKAEQLAASGGFLARRLSGGGCVYHDMGNLNFTFLAKKELYDVDNQLSVILRALEKFGLRGEKTGRNDLCIEGKKFSGNAFFKDKNCCYHHGTLLVNVDIGKMGQYLQVSAEKLEAHSVASVKSRVVNLQELCQDLTIESLSAALIEAYGELYAPPVRIANTELNPEKVAALTEKYASDAWRYGESMEADYTMRQKYPWGEVELLLQMQGNKVADVQIFSDSMEESLAEVLTGSLRGVLFEKDALVAAVAKTKGQLPPEIHNDITNLIQNQEIW